VLPPKKRWKWTFRDLDDGINDTSKNRYITVKGEREGKVLREILIKLLADSRFNYPRANPFNSYPVNAQDYMPIAVNFYT
jgi:hypothetical protein